MPPGQVANHPHLVAGREAPVGLQRRGLSKERASPLSSPNRNRTLLSSMRRRRSALPDFAPSRSISTTDSGWGDSFVALGPAEAAEGSITARNSAGTNRLSRLSRCQLHVSIFSAPWNCHTVTLFCRVHRRGHPGRHPNETFIVDRFCRLRICGHAYFFCVSYADGTRRSPHRRNR